jgi:hypothetical protein
MILKMKKLLLICLVGLLCLLARSALLGGTVTPTQQESECAMAFLKNAGDLERERDNFKHGMSDSLGGFRLKSHLCLTGLALKKKCGSFDRAKNVLLQCEPIYKEEVIKNATKTLEVCEKGSDQPLVNNIIEGARSTADSTDGVLWLDAVIAEPLKKAKKKLPYYYPFIDHVFMNSGDIEEEPVLAWAKLKNDESESSIFKDRMLDRIESGCLVSRILNVVQDLKPCSILCMRDESSSGRGMLDKLHIRSIDMGSLAISLGKDGRGALRSWINSGLFDKVSATSLVKDAVPYNQDRLLKQYEPEDIGVFAEGALSLLYDLLDLADNDGIMTQVYNCAKAVNDGSDGSHKLVTCAVETAREIAEEILAHTNTSCRYVRKYTNLWLELFASLVVGCEEAWDKEGQEWKLLMRVIAADKTSQTTSRERELVKVVLENLPFRANTLEKDFELRSRSYQAKLELEEECGSFERAEEVLRYCEPYAYDPKAGYEHGVFVQALELSLGDLKDCEKKYYQPIVDSIIEGVRSTADSTEDAVWLNAVVAKPVMESEASSRYKSVSPDKDGFFPWGPNFNFRLNTNMVEEAALALAWAKLKNDEPDSNMFKDRMLDRIKNGCFVLNMLNMVQDLKSIVGSNGLYFTNFYRFVSIGSLAISLGEDGRKELRSWINSGLFDKVSAASLVKDAVPYNQDRLPKQYKWLFANGALSLVYDLLDLADNDEIMTQVDKCAKAVNDNSHELVTCAVESASKIAGEILASTSCRYVRNYTNLSLEELFVSLVAGRGAWRNKEGQEWKLLTKVIAEELNKVPQTS